MKSFFLNNHIGLYKNALSSKDCQFYIDKFESSLEENRVYYETGNYTRLGLLIENEEKIRNSLFPHIQKYKKEHKYLETMPHVWGCNIGCNLQRFFPGDAYDGEHMEHGPDNNDQYRILAWMFYLNTIKKGGGTYWPQQNYKSKPLQGSLLIWPAGWTHSHYGIIAPNEFKYIITGWCSFDI